MFWILLALFITIPAVEIGVFIWAGGHIGVWSVIAFIILTGILGTWLVKYQGFETFRQAQESMQYGEAPREQILDGICIILGAILLLTPGFVTDLIGFLLVIPLTRKPFKLYISHLIRKKIANGTFIYRRW